MFEAIGRNQYLKFKESKENLTDIIKLDESRGLDETIWQVKTALETYHHLSKLTIEYLMYFKLWECTLKKRSNCTIITLDLLTSYHSVSPKVVTLSSAWYDQFVSIVDVSGKRQTLGRDMSLSLLSFIHHIQLCLHTNVELLLHQYPSIQQGGPLYFNVLIHKLVLSDKHSCDALVSLVQAYNIATDGKDNLLPVMKLLHSETKSIITIRSDSRNRHQLPDPYVKHMLTVL